MAVPRRAQQAAPLLGSKNSARRLWREMRLVLRGRAQQAAPLRETCGLRRRMWTERRGIILGWLRVFYADGIGCGEFELGWAIYFALAGDAGS